MKNVELHVRIGERLFKALVSIAEEEEVSISSLTRTALQTLVREHLQRSGRDFQLPNRHKRL